MTAPSRRRALQRLSSLALLLGAGEIAWGAGIVAVRVWPAADYTRVTIESDAALVARHQVVDHPERLVIDIDGLELSPQLRELVGQVRADDPYIAGVRVGQNAPRVVRLVVDLKQPILPQQFTLQPVAAYQHRLVFDLYPTRPRDPLLALLEEKQQAELRAAQSVQDALGEFIDRMKPAGAAAGSAGAGPTEADAPHAPSATAPGAPPFKPALGGTAGPPTGASTPPSGRGAPLAVAPPVPAVPAPALPPSKAPPPSPALRAQVDRLVIVALDPGHGGEDPGAVGPSGLREKDVVLSVALQLRERLDGELGMRAFLTRDADFFVPLADRVKKARRVQADLFVSIHADAFLTPAARGASVFALSQGGASSSAARWMASRENAADTVGGVNVASADAVVLRTLLDMSTTAQIKDSLKLGSEVLGQLDRVGKLHKGQVEQAGFAVLKAPDIPSILVETAFISNPDEESKLRDPDYQRELVKALAVGIKRYFAKNPPLARQRQL